MIELVLHEINVTNTNSKPTNSTTSTNRKYYSVNFIIVSAIDNL